MTLLLIFCGLLDLTNAAVNLLMLDLDGSIAVRLFVQRGNVARDVGVLSFAAGLSAIVAGFWNRGRNYGWLLSVHGLALAAYGAIGLSPLVRTPLNFRPISLLFLVMALSLAALVGKRGGWGHSALATSASLYAVSYLVVGFWVKLEPVAFWSWMGGFFAVCGVSMLFLSKPDSLPTALLRRAL